MRGRPPVRHHDQGQVLQRAAVGLGEVGRDLQAVRGPVGDDVHRRDVLGLEAQIGVADRGGLVRVQVDHDVGHAVGLAGDLDHDPAAVVAPGGELDLLARERLEDAVPFRLVGGSEEHIVARGADGHPADDAMGGPVRDVVLEAIELLRRGRDRPVLQGHQLQPVVARRPGVHQQRRPVGAEALHLRRILVGPDRQGVHPLARAPQLEDPALGLLRIGDLGQELAGRVDQPVAVVQVGVGVLHQLVAPGGEVDREQGGRPVAVDEGDAAHEHHGPAVDDPGLGRPGDDVHLLGLGVGDPAVQPDLLVGLQQLGGLALGQVQALRHLPFRLVVDQPGHVAGDRLQHQEVVAVGPDQVAHLLVGAGQAGHHRPGVGGCDHHHLLALDRDHIGQLGAVR